MIQQLGNYFIRPQNLAALALLLVLILLYLLKPKPERKMMPSVMFFQEDENPGKLKQGIRKILRNKFLLLHLLLFSLIAVSLADPYISQPAESQQRTIYLDATANTAENFQKYRRYAQNHLGETNNLVIVSNRTTTYTDLTEAGAQQIISDVQPTEQRKNLDNSLAAARSLEGNLFLATNLASLTSAEADQTIDKISSEKNIDIKTSEFDNSWGITDYSISDDSVEIYVKNYGSQSADPALHVNSEHLRQLNLNSSGLTTLEVSLQQGRNNITLSDDEFNIDNSLYIYKPDSRILEVEASGEHPYIREAVKAIPEARLADQEPDIIFRDSSESGSLEAEDIRNGMNLVYMADGEGQQPGFLPVEGVREVQGDVKVNKPVQTQLYSATYLEGRVDSDAVNLTVPASAIVKQQIGDGTVVQYNILDNSFSRQLSFPIFWRKVFRDVAGVPTVRNANIATGSSEYGFSTSEQGYRLSESGQYGVSTYGVFTPKNPEIEQGNGISTRPQSVSAAVNVLILVLLLLETFLLARERLI